MKSNAGNDRNAENVSRDSIANNMEKSSTVPNDLPDSPEDAAKLEEKETVIDLPEVKDIPGQEFVNAPPLGEMADTTISSDDEEGVRVFGEDDQISDDDFDVTQEEKQILERTETMPGTDKNNLQRASMDNVDFEGEPLNEKGFGQGIGDIVSDEDLDINADDEEGTTDISEGDEENQSYSLGGDDNDD